MQAPSMHACQHATVKHASMHTQRHAHMQACTQCGQASKRQPAAQLWANLESYPECLKGGCG
eukprot:14622969-Alexandrium_andersonii.AAC.1